MSESKAKPGRPKHKIDWGEVARLSEIHCTSIEIASALNIPHSTLTGREEFSEIYKKSRAIGKHKLRQAQWDKAESGNPTMQIWLGKQWLKQSDNPEVDGGGFDAAQVAAILKAAYSATDTIPEG